MPVLKARLLVHEEATKEAFQKVKSDFMSVKEYIDALKESINHLNSESGILRSAMQGLNDLLGSVRNDIAGLEKDNLQTKNAQAEMGANLVNLSGDIGMLMARAQQLSKEMGLLESTSAFAYKKSKELAKRFSLQQKNLNRLQASMNSHANKLASVNSLLRNNEKNDKKLRNFVRKKIKSLSAKNAELEDRLRKTRKRLVQLNKKFEQK